MPETTPPNHADAGLEVRTYYVRSRNALLARADFGELYVDYYLHLSAQGIKVQPEHDALFKRALAGFTLHSASRPWNELTAWTINVQSPLVNLFLTGDNETGAVTGRVFEVEGGMVSVADGWHHGTVADKGGRWDPAELGPVVRDLIAKGPAPTPVYGAS